MKIKYLLLIVAVVGLALFVYRNFFSNNPRDAVTSFYLLEQSDSGALAVLSMEDSNPEEQLMGTAKKITKDQLDELESQCSTEEITYYYYERRPFKPNQNNIFGLYIYAEDTDFIDIASRLVNSKGGNWGYVLIPYNIEDRDRKKWSRVFTKLLDEELIPIILLHADNLKDLEDDTEKAASFLDSFLWPIKERYISVYNEPNDADFWFGRVDPKEYAEILDMTTNVFKKQNEDFFVMNGAFNVSAPTTTGYLDSFEFMRKMNDAVPGVFERLDGWASHPYPQPNFSGNPRAQGRWSIRAYENELSFLKDDLGVRKNLPVFITETGWAHAEGVEYNGSFPNAETAAANFEIAFTEVWMKDSRIRAVIPFTILYAPPFDHFSWVNSDKVPYKQYEVVKSIPKIEGIPNKLIKAQLRNTCD